MTNPLALNGRSLTLEEFLEVVRGHREVSIAPDARAAALASRHAVDRVVASHRPVYGVTTGFGGLSHQTIPPAQLRELQRSLVRSHASGTGPALPGTSFGDSYCSV